MSSGHNTGFDPRPMPYLIPFSLNLKINTHVTLFYINPLGLCTDFPTANSNLMFMEHGNLETISIYITLALDIWHNHFGSSNSQMRNNVTNLGKTVRFKMKTQESKVFGNEGRQERNNDGRLLQLGFVHPNSDLEKLLHLTLPELYSLFAVTRTIIYALNYRLHDGCQHTIRGNRTTGKLKLAFRNSWRDGADCATMVRARIGRRLDAVLWRLCRAAAAAPPRYCGTRPSALPRATATHPPSAPRAPHSYRATARTHAAFLRSARPQARIRPAQRT